MDTLAASIQELASSVLTEAICIGCGLMILLILVVLALVIEASDNDSGKSTTRTPQNENLPVV